ncbi:drug resistance transporter, Bcr/CflA subfamily protein [Paraburkholderia xenovorans LB400]|uniref:Bcr/CflA family efflux transporter n=1 Tax=Paraburkholderia xenovorans (strain LB400) TaxID=266265 RepID=Q13FL8_PARXL|nr:multidrug effflux MFS transporter [Paraburkholderia xenovorans]ABE37121.1 major facilitator superfamily (MFS) multidrug efflux pump, Bcr/CflA subfamily [Paraburkholderia xenovorans LB400]AIP34509.1 drug resistance transporter, Bcr/CflA subfamily protein [Paraburkholderia xenovorans LB400]
MDNLQDVRANRTPDLKYLLGFIIAIGPVSVDMYLPAASAIALEFGRSTPQLTLAAYFAGFAVGQLTQGLISDRFGRRAPLAAGLTIYTLASICCALAQGTASFCAFRALAAFGAAASIVVPRAMVRDLADGAKAAALMSGVMQVMSVAPVVAPVLGSLVLEFASWRMIFVVAALYGALSLALMACFLPETLPRERRLPTAVATSLRLFGSVLRERQFLSNALVGTFGMGALFAFLAGSPTVFMTQYGYAPTAYGLTLALIGAATVGCFRVNTWLVQRRGAPRVISLGVALWSIASGYLVWCGLRPPLHSWPVFIALLVFTLGYCFIPSNTQVGALSRHAAHAASATALMSTMQYSAGAVAGALVGKLADGTARPMAAVMLGCALAAALAARFRPRGNRQYV